jgi:hypothetical protein
MPALAHFQVAKTVYDLVDKRTKAGDPPNRRELMAELRPVLSLLGRAESTAQQMLDVLMRIGAIERDVSRYYQTVREIDLAKFATAVDRNNKRRKMLISYQELPVPAGAAEWVEESDFAESTAL